MRISPLEYLGQKFLLLLLGAPDEDGISAKASARVVIRRQRQVVVVDLLFEHDGVVDGQAAAAVFLGSPLARAIPCRPGVVPIRDGVGTARRSGRWSQPGAGCRPGCCRGASPAPRCGRLPARRYRLVRSPWHASKTAGTWPGRGVPGISRALCRMGRDGATGRDCRPLRCWHAVH